MDFLRLHVKLLIINDSFFFFSVVAFVPIDYLQASIETSLENPASRRINNSKNGHRQQQQQQQQQQQDAGEKRNESVESHRQIAAFRIESKWQQDPSA